MKIGELIRIIVFGIIGGLTMSLLQPVLYKQNVFGIIQSFDFDKWVLKYNQAAFIVFTVSFAFTILWYIIALINQNDARRGPWRLLWYIGLGLLVLTVSLSVYFNNRDEKGELIDETLFSMMGLFLVNSLVLLYWLPTVTSTPGLLKKGVVPGSSMINGILGRR